MLSKLQVPLGIVAILCNRNQIPDATKYIKSLPTALRGPVVYEMLICKWCGKNKEEAIKFAESLPDSQKLPKVSRTVRFRWCSPHSLAHVPKKDCLV
jgi:hypothetical protein